MTQIMQRALFSHGTGARACGGVSARSFKS